MFERNQWYHFKMTTGSPFRGLVKQYEPPLIKLDGGTLVSLYNVISADPIDEPDPDNPPFKSM